MPGEVGCSPGFLLGLLREAPNRRRLIRSLALGNQSGDRRVTSADGTSLSVRTSGSGTPLVLVHGTLDGIGAFSLIELELAEQYAVWVYDRRGRGGSGDAQDYAFEREVDDLRAVIAETGSTPHVLGHSFGGVVALQAALSGVEMRSLILYEPPLNGKAVTRDHVASIHRAIAEHRLDDAITTVTRELAGVSDDELHVAMQVPPVREHLREGVRTVPRELEAIRACDWGNLPLTDVPVLTIRGARTGSSIYPTNEQAAALAIDTEIEVLPDQDHLAHTFAPSVFAEVVLDYLDRRSRRAA